MIRDEQQAQATLSRAIDLFKEESFEEALPLFEESLAWYSEQNDEVHEAIIRFFVGQILAATQDIARARAEITTAHALFGEIDDVVGQARMRLELGELAYWEQQYDIATKHFNRVLERLSDENAPDLTAMAHARLGAIAAEAEDLARAEREYRQALEYYDRTGDTLNAANAVIELATAVQETQPARARRLFERGRDMAQATGNDYLASMALHGLGVLHADDEEWADAVQSYRIALELKERCNDREGEIFTYLALGAAERELGREHAAHTAWQRALTLAQEAELDDAATVAQTLLQGNQHVTA